MTETVEGFTQIADAVGDELRRAYLDKRKRASQARKAKRATTPASAQRAQKPSQTTSGKVLSGNASQIPPVNLSPSRNADTFTATPDTQSAGHDQAAPSASPSVASAYSERTRKANVTRKLQAANAGPPERLLQGRPTFWTPDQSAPWKEAIILHIAEGKSLLSFCRDNPDGPSRATVLMNWLNPDNASFDATFASNYTHAREHGGDRLAEDITEIADSVRDAGPTDSARVNAARLMVDARKWVASKLKPGNYADRLETVHSGNVAVTHKLSEDDRALALASLLRRQAITQAGSMPEAIKTIEGHVTLLPGPSASKSA